MKKILYIKANPKGSENSRTLKISDALSKKYQNEGHSVTELDLYKENLNHLLEHRIDLSEYWRMVHNKVLKKTAINILFKVTPEVA